MIHGDADRGNWREIQGGRTPPTLVADPADSGPNSVRLGQGRQRRALVAGGSTSLAGPKTTTRAGCVILELSGPRHNPPPLISTQLRGARGGSFGRTRSGSGNYDERDAPRVRRGSVYRPPAPGRR